MDKQNPAYKNGLMAGFPIALGYLAVSFTLGIAAKGSGLTAFQATLMSFTNNTSAGQFAALGLIKEGASYLLMAANQLIINLRYLLMSFALSQKLDSQTPLMHRLIIGFDITDENFAVSINQNGLLDPGFFYGLMTVSIIGWSAGTFLGVIIGGLLPWRVLSAMEIALYGMFIAIVVPPAKKNKPLGRAVVIAMFTSAAMTYLPIFEKIMPGLRIIILTVLISAFAATFHPVKTG